MTVLMPARKGHRDADGNWHHPTLTLDRVDRRLLNGDPLPSPSTPKHKCPVCGAQTSGSPASAKRIGGVTVVTAPDDRCPPCHAAGWIAEQLFPDK